MPYDESLFAGAAPHYARYRVPYPSKLIADIVAHYGLDSKGRLLDLGCGPGTLTLPLSPHFESVLALDIDASMIDEARYASSSFESLRMSGPLDWRVMAAEEISPALGTFRLVTCGSSFHWMDRDLVLGRAREALEPGCGIALAAGIRPWWDGPEDWHQSITATVKRYLGDRRRAGATAFKEAGELFEQTLERNGWRVELNRDYPSQHEWNVDSVIGHLWSTSFANRSLLGDKAEQFEAELREGLVRLRPDGVFRETGLFGLVCGRPG
jgi:SAM-dependent methyltransferase